jgi:hypothetical protein
MIMYLAWLPTLLMCRWNKLVQKPFEDGDVRGLKLLQAILRPLMLRRTKESCDRDGRCCEMSGDIQSLLFNAPMFFSAI